MSATTSVVQNDEQVKEDATKLNMLVQGGLKRIANLRINAENARSLCSL